MDNHDITENLYREPVGLPSDEVPEILATGRSDIDTLYLSMAQRHPQGYDADYLRWHSMDHRPEQQRLRSIRTSIRLVSTPACRRARACDGTALDAVDHVMIYFFAGREGLQEFYDLAVALNDAGRSPFILPPVGRGAYTLANCLAAPRIRTGADVLPWLPVRGIYLLVEKGEAPAGSLLETPGVAGELTAVSFASEHASFAAGQQITLLFLDEEPEKTAQALRPVLDRRWTNSDCKPLLAAPMQCVVPYEWDRYLP